MKDNTLNLLGITIQKLFNYTNDKLGRIARCVYRNNIERLKLKNTDFTIFSQNCIGSIMYHDLGQPFKSPTINLLITPKDFIRFMGKIQWYLKQPIIFIKSDKTYPVGKIGEIEIKFIHYHSEDEVLNSWKRRMDRINWNNVFVLCCDEGLEYDDMVEYDHLPFKNKILFMHKNEPSIKCGINAKIFKTHTDARLLEFCNIFGKRYYQRYVDYIKWLNEGNYWV